mmetsp:Transcript_3137/g.4832  ORF Transcript_3137/g.4832 Transcript_3137/m.4832 type:complete len:555 (+) Transcript_3137:110-1774(+)|eukprot:CAMPEP_0171462562 /NCGR_PEP_ID=MMETSP0945-20130129/6550_1 /TAXON_ID=109269 /ORGANISM="Vaucheria litorea, Strain CCMP2940" /LENGTH=554 /DNA_ID=CAMNT_0011989113 /DNA_START=98 /DNA_END=1762 /DNA_ORIENTATION=+
MSKKDSKKTQKISLGEFLGDETDPNSELPKGPDLTRDPNDTGRNYGRGMDNRRNSSYDQGPMPGDRSMDANQWRNSRNSQNFPNRQSGGNRYNEGYNNGPSYQRINQSSYSNQRDEKPMERPANKRLNLAPKTESSGKPSMETVPTVTSQPAKSKPNPFGEARAVDTARKELEIERKMPGLNLRSSSEKFERESESRNRPGFGSDSKSAGKWVSPRLELNRASSISTIESRDSRWKGSRDEPVPIPASNAFKSRFKTDPRIEDSERYDSRRRNETIQQVPPMQFRSKDRQTDDPIENLKKDEKILNEKVDVSVEEKVVVRETKAVEKVEKISAEVPAAVAADKKPTQNQDKSAPETLKKIEPKKDKKSDNKAKPSKSASKKAQKQAKKIPVSKGGEIESKCTEAEKAISSGKIGSELVSILKEMGENIPNAGAFILEMLRTCGKPALDKWANDEEYGKALKFLAPENNKKEQVLMLYGVQMYVHEVGFPKIGKEALVLKIFTFLYSKDIIVEEAFEEWSEDVDDTTPGKQNSLIQTTNFFEFLKQASEEESEEE